MDSQNSTTIETLSEISSVKKIKKVLQKSKKIICNICNKTFATQRNLNRHRIEFHEDHQKNRLTCNICGKSFSRYRKIDLIRHIRNVHEGHKDHKCTICSKLYFHKRELNRHIRIVHERNKDIYECNISGVHECEKHKPCPICNKAIEKNCLKSHIKKVHEEQKKDSTSDITLLSKTRLKKDVTAGVKINSRNVSKLQKEYKCHWCDKISTNSYNIERHIGRLHPEKVQNSFKCELCLSLINTYISKSHILRNHYNQSDQICDKCGKFFSDAEYLIAHVNTDHSKIHQAKICDSCGLSFSTPGKMKRHFISVHGDFELYKCDICDQTFRYHESLIAHVKHFHKESHKTSCDKCNKSFTTARTLKVHVMRIHQGIINYNCELCDRIFSYPQQLKTHMRYIHEGEKDYKCDTCGKFFSAPQGLRTHISAIHEGKKDNTCESCGKSFNQPGTLQRHKHTVHEGHKDHKCIFCGLSFAQSWTLRRHVDTFHTNSHIIPNELKIQIDSQNTNMTSRSADEIVHESDSINGPGIGNESMNATKDYRNQENNYSNDSIGKQMGIPKRVSETDSKIAQDFDITRQEENNQCIEYDNRQTKALLHVPIFSEMNSEENDTESLDAIVKQEIVSDSESSDDSQNESMNVQESNNTKIDLELAPKEFITSKEDENIGTKMNKSISYNNQESSTSNSKVDATKSIMRKIIKIKLIDFTICNCKNKETYVSSHYCDDCNEGFCEFCIEAHQRFKVTRMHKIIRINYCCKCRYEEKSSAAKYCTECCEFFCTDCINAHQKLIITRHHILKSI